MIDISRHITYFNPIKKGIPITIIGAGATGSRVFESCVNLGLKDITVFDFDTIEEHNLANQLFTESQVGMPKVQALGNWYEEKTGDKIPESIKLFQEKVEGDMKDRMKGIIYLLTDSMASRREIGDNSLKLNNNVLTVIETRMAISHGNVFCFEPANLLIYNKWLNTLIDDADAETSVCGASLTIGTTANMIANLAVNHMISYLINPEVMPDPVTDIFLNPLDLNTRDWS